METTLNNVVMDLRSSEAGIVLRFDLPNDNFFEVELDEINCIFLKAFLQERGI